MFEPDETEPYDLFISYAEQDRGWAEGYLVDSLRDRGVRCITRAGLQRGAFRPAEFGRAVRESRRVVLVFSRAYLADVSQAFVENLAQDRALKDNSATVIPLLLDDVELPDWAEARICLRGVTVAEQAQAVEVLAREMPPGPPKDAELACPYPGMRPFGRDDAAYFRGRKALAEELLQVLRYRSCLFLSGPSGSGKTSLVRAALVPALEKEGWSVSEMQPGATPAALLSAQAEGAGRLLVVDAFEQVFTQAPAEEAKSFQEALTALAAKADHKLIVTVRSDFYTDLEASPIFPLFHANQRPVQSLGTEELREAIVGPANKVNVYLEPALVERLVADAAGQPGALPHLQETLQLLWKKRRRRYLPAEAYAELGRGGRNGLQVAMAVVADAAVDAILNDEEVVRRVFLRLVQFDEGRDTRRRQPLTALAAGEPRDRFERVRRHLESRRLLVSDDVKVKVAIEGKVVVKSIPVVDIVHDSLITGWPRLQGWIAEYRDDERTRRDLEAKVAEWERSGRIEGWLDAAGLRRVEGWLARPYAGVVGGGTPELTALLQASKDRLAEEAERWKAIAERAERERKVAIGRQLAAQAELVRNQRAAHLPLSVLLAIEAARRASGVEIDFALRNGLRLLPRQIAEVVHAKTVGSVAFSPDGRSFATASWDFTARVYDLNAGREVLEVPHDQVVAAVAFSPDSRMLATASDDRTAYVVDIASRRTLARFPHGAAVKDVAFSPNGVYVATASDFPEGMARIWAIPSGRELARVAYGNVAQQVLFSPDGRYLASTNWVKPVIVLEVETGRRIELPQQGGTLALAFSPDGRFLACSGGDRTIEIRDTAGWQRVADVRQAAGEMQFCLAFSPSGRLLASANGRYVVIWDTSTWLEVRRLYHEDGVSRLDWCPEGRYLATATASPDKTARVWEVETGEEVARMAHDEQVSDVAFAPDGRAVLTGGRDGKARLWEPTGHREIARLAPPGNAEAVAFSPDGRFLAAACNRAVPLQGPPLPGDGACLWDASIWQKVRLAVDIGDAVAVAFHPNGDRLALAGSNGRAWVVGLPGGEVVPLPFEGGRGAVAFNPTGDLLAIGGLNAVVYAWRGHGWNEVAVLPHDKEVTGLCFGPEGRWLATASHDGAARVWEWSRLSVVATFRHPDHLQRADRGPDTTYNRLQGVAFTPDGCRLVTASVDSTARVWDIASGQQVLRLSHEDMVNAVAVDAAGRFVATASSDKTARVWEHSTGQEVVRLRHDNSATSVAFAPDGRSLATASYGHTVRVVLLRTEDLVAEACRRLTRDLNTEEWEQYLGTEPYSETRRCLNKSAPVVATTGGAG